MDQNESAAEYFKEHPGYHRLFCCMREKYSSIGRLGGTLQLNRLKEEEKEALEGFLQRSFRSQKSASISVEHFNKALQATKFSGCDLQAILEIYFNGSLVSKKEEKDKALQEQEQFFSKVYGEFQKTRAGEWFGRIIKTREMPFPNVLADYYKDKVAAAQRLGGILQGLNALPVFSDSIKRIAMFAAEITSNPHFFDEGEKVFTVFLYGISDLLGLPYPKKRTAEVTAEFLYQAGLMKDDISNFVVCAGMRGWMKADGKEHMGMRAACSYREPQQLSLFHLSLLDKIQGQGERVYIVENPAIFMNLLEAGKGGLSLVCGNGQPNLAVLILLDLVVKNGGILYYSGDFDPEGLLIADRMKLRYGENLKLWHYSKEDYDRAISREVISLSRMKQLDRLSTEELKEAGKWLKETGAAGYQERLIINTLV